MRVCSMDACIENALGEAVSLRVCMYMYVCVLMDVYVCSLHVCICMYMYWWVAV